MVAGPDGDAVAVEDLRDVVRVDALHLEGDDAAAIVARGRPEDGQARDLGDALEGVGGELGLGGVDGGQPELIDPANRGAEPDRLADRRGAALELGGQVGPGDQLLVTFRIIEPPPMKGGISSSSSRRPKSAPMPVGPYILWAVRA